MEQVDSKAQRLGPIATVVLAGVIVGSIGGLFAFVVDTREDVVRLEAELSSVRATANSNTNRTDGLPAQLATLTAQMTQVQRDVTEIKASLEKRSR